MSEPVLYRAHMACTACHWKAALRYTLVQVEFARTLDPEVILGTYKCQNTRCGMLNYVCAEAQQRATPEPARKPLVPNRRAA